MSEGRVIVVGAGPGAADLITLRGARALAQASVVLFDALTDPALRAHIGAVGGQGLAFAPAQVPPAVIGERFATGQQAALCQITRPGLVALGDLRHLGRAGAGKGAGLFVQEQEVLVHGVSPRSA